MVKISSPSTRFHGMDNSWPKVDIYYIPKLYNDKRFLKITPTTIYEFLSICLYSLVSDNDNLKNIGAHTHTHLNLIKAKYKIKQYCER